MRLKNPFHQQPEIGIVIVTGSCCIPGMAPFDEQARYLVEQAIAETGIQARIKTVPVTLVLAGGLGKELLAEGIALAQKSDRLPLPAVLVNGKLIQAGVPSLEVVKSALMDAKNQIGKEKQGAIK